MPRPSKGARLWLQPDELSGDGSIRKRSVWVIRDGARKVSTGCAPGDRAGAEQALAQFITAKHQAPRLRGRHPSEILIADVLTIYVTDVGPQVARYSELKQRVAQLAEWWQLRKLIDVNGRSCRDYVAWRIKQPVRSAKPEKTGNPARLVSPAAARRELEDLRAAINHHRKEGLCSEVVEVVLPAKPLPRERWLTRSEAARLLWAAWRYHEIQKGVPTDRRSRRHLARFILVALYTGTRSAAICGAALAPEPGRGWIDLDSGVFFRRAIGVRETNKRQTPVRLPTRLIAHIRRWQESGASRHSVVEWNGEAVTSVKKSFGRAVADAGLGPEVTPHILRHTCATWLMQAGVDLWDAASFLGMTVQQLEATYGHHHPDFQSAAAEALGGQNGDRNNGNKTRRPASNVTQLSAFAKASG